MLALLLSICCLVSGVVHAPSGTPISGAKISLSGAAVITATSDARGRFSMQAAPGIYHLHAFRTGYAPVTVSPVHVSGDTTLDVTLEAADSPQLRTIGTVTVNGRLARISGAIPSVIMTRADLERTGGDRITEGLLDIPSLDVQYPHNGGSAGLATVSLRGPDPSETMLTLDGQLLNDANTGDVDISQLPVAAFSSIDVSEGLGPQDLEGSSTIGGAVNLISLRPTREAHSAYSLSAGSFGQSEAWFNATGSQSKFGYAFALDDQQEAGYVNETDTVCSFDYSTCAPQHLGSGTSQRSALANVTYAFSQSSDIGARVFTLGDTRDQSAGIAGIDAASGVLVGPGPQTLSQNIRAYELHGRTVLGAGELVGSLSRADDNVGIAGGGISNPMYDLSHADERTNEALQWGRSFADSSFAFGGYLRQERFAAPGAVPELTQTIASYFARAAWRPASRLHLGAGVYLSNYSTFGSNVDGRLSAVYDTDPQTSLRFSAGTGFRAPLLIERYVFSSGELPPPDNNCVIQGQGNPNEKPEHATEYELGVSHQFGSNATMDASFYRTNLRDPIENYYPGNTCPATSYSYPINIGNAVYEGAELKFIQRFPRAHTFVTAMYGLNVAYPANMPETISNPTSGAYIVNNEQFPNIPQQQASLEGDWGYNGWHAAATGVFRGTNNPLNQPQVIFVDAAVGRQIAPHLDLTLAGTNLFNAAAGKFQVFNGGRPYYGVVGPGQYGPLPTNLLTVEPAGVRLILTLRH
ncbi:MAG TPA: TonB-dependent receptor [Candidatus Baltobacteraceae bacterium]|nr:TonB-dependent receptor [Candidatus Baltobacteraceae bacterium]